MRHGLDGEGESWHFVVCKVSFQLCGTVKPPEDGAAGKNKRASNPDKCLGRLDLCCCSLSFPALRCSYKHEQIHT